MSQVAARILEFDRSLPGDNSSFDSPTASIELWDVSGNQQYERTYPAINVNKSGTRREELLIPQEILQKIWVLRKLLYPMEDVEAMEFLLDKVKSTKNNDDFFNSMRK